MKRKIVQHGSSSLTITLPVKWVNKYGLKKGAELEVEEDGSRLILNTQEDIVNLKKEIFSKDMGLFTKNDLSHLYQLGYDDVEITFNDTKTLNEIKSRVSECIGYEIIDQRSNKVHIKSIVTTIETEFDTLLRKSFQVTNEMARELLDALKNKNFGELSNIRSMEGLNNRFTDICIRILNKKGYTNQKRTMQMYEIVKNIERIADEFKYISDIFKDYKGKISDINLKLFSEVIDYYFVFYNMMYNFKPELKEDIFLLRKPLIIKIENQLEKAKAKETFFLHHQLSILQKVYEGVGGYLTLTL
jgi:phosphate uptake regulator